MMISARVATQGKDFILRALSSQESFKLVLCCPGNSNLVVPTGEYENQEKVFVTISLMST
jgi:hypothetical protein